MSRPKTAKKSWLFDFDRKRHGDKHKELRIATLTIFLVLGLLSLLLSTQVGLNGDEDVQVQYSADLLKFYGSFGEDTSAFKSIKGDQIRYYGGAYEIPVAVINKILGFDVDHSGNFIVRHLMSMLFGLLAIFFTMLLARDIGGWRCALLVVCFAFASPRLIGHSMINPKDVPFAAGYIMMIYYSWQLLKKLPEINWKEIFLLALSIGIVVGVRINGGILVIVYLFFFLGIHFISKEGLRSLTSIKTLRPYLVGFLVPSLSGLVIGLLFWPYGLSNPFAHIPEAMDAFSNFYVAIKVLFDGSMVWSHEIPVRYVGTWILFTIPLFIPAGLLLFFGFLRSHFRYYSRFSILLLLFTFLFPLVYVLVSGSVLYDGWRHFTFTYPSLLVLVALSWNYLIEKFESQKQWSFITYGVIGILIFEPLFFQIRNTPFMYTYFNPVSGGIKKAFGKYELDYWGTSVKQAFDWMEEEGIISQDMDDTVYIASNFTYALAQYAKEYDGLVVPRYVRWRQRYDRQWDYGIFVNRFVDASFLRGGHWPTDKSIHEIKVNSVPIAIIVKEDESQDAFYGSEAIRQKEWTKAIEHLLAETQRHPNNEISFTELGMAYLNMGQTEKALAPLQRALEIVPENQNALNFTGYYYYVSDDLVRARTHLAKAVEFHQTNTFAMYYLALIDFRNKHFSQALETIDDCIRVGSNIECYNLGAQIYQAMGDETNARRYMDAYRRAGGR